MDVLKAGNGLPGNDVNCMVQDSKGNVWIGTEYGISKFNGTNWKILIFKNATTNYVYSIFQDNSGDMWFGSLAGAMKYRTGNFTSLTENNGLVSNQVKNITQDTSGLEAKTKGLLFLYQRIVYFSANSYFDALMISY